MCGDQGGGGPLAPMAGPVRTPSGGVGSSKASYVAVPTRFSRGSASTGCCSNLGPRWLRITGVHDLYKTRKSGMKHSPFRTGLYSKMCSSHSPPELLRKLQTITEPGAPCDQSSPYGDKSN